MTPKEAPSIPGPTDEATIAGMVATGGEAQELRTALAGWSTMRP